MTFSIPFDSSVLLDVYVSSHREFYHNEHNISPYHKYFKLSPFPTMVQTPCFFVTYVEYCINNGGETFAYLKQHSDRQAIHNNPLRMPNLAGGP